MKIFASSANKTEKHDFDTDDRSFIYTKNNNGPNIDLWVTPHAMAF